MSYASWVYDMWHDKANESDVASIDFEPDVGLQWGMDYIDISLDHVTYTQLQLIHRIPILIP